MNFSESSCSSFSLTDSESEKESEKDDDCPFKRQEDDNFPDDNGDTTKAVQNDGTKAEEDPPKEGAKSITVETKKNPNTIEESKKEERVVCKMEKEEIVFRYKLKSKYIPPLKKQKY